MLCFVNNQKKQILPIFLGLLACSLSQGAELSTKSCSKIYHVLMPADETTRFKGIDLAISVRINREKISLGWEIANPNASFLSNSSSYVYVSQDKKWVLKFYPVDKEKMSAKGQTFYEYWVTKYLQSKGIPVLDIPTPATYSPHPVTKDQGYWILKPYIKGIAPEFNHYQLITQSGPHAGAKIAGIRQPNIRKMLEKRIKEVKQAFNAQDFLNYIKENSDIKNPEKAMAGFPKWERGDFEEKRNWLFTENGWILIDP